MDFFTAYHIRGHQRLSGGVIAVPQMCIGTLLFSWQPAHAAAEPTDGQRFQSSGGRYPGGGLKIAKIRYFRDQHGTGAGVGVLYLAVVADAAGLSEFETWRVVDRKEIMEDTVAIGF